jgi:hypothetical protein
MLPIPSHTVLDKPNSQDHVYTDDSIDLDSVYTVVHDLSLNWLVLKLST